MTGSTTSVRIFSGVLATMRTPLTSVLGFAKLISRDFANNFLPLAQDQDRLTQRGKRILDNLEIIRSDGPVLG